MTDRAWKAAERRTAKLLGGRRIPVTGIDRHGADVVTPLFHIQNKHGRNRPSYLDDWLSGICGTARDAEKIGLVVWSSKGEKQADAIVMMRLADFVSLHGPMQPSDADTQETRR